MKRKEIVISLIICLLVCVCLRFVVVHRDVALLDTVVGKVDTEFITLKDYNNTITGNNRVIGNTEDSKDPTDLYINAMDTLAHMTGGQMDYATEKLNRLVIHNLIMQKATELKLYPLSETDQTTVTAISHRLFKMNADEYTKNGITEDILLTNLIEIKTVQLLMAEVTKNITMPDTDVKAAYDKLLSYQKYVFTQNASYYDYMVTGYWPPIISSTPPDVFKTMQDILHIKDGNDINIIVYRPEGYRFIKHILIPFPNDIDMQIIRHLNGKSSDQTIIHKVREENLAKIKPLADEVLAKAQAGGDFEELMIPLMAHHNPAGSFQNNFYRDSEYQLGSGTDFERELKDAVLKLAKVGDITGLVATDYGYHIIKWVGIVPAGPVAYEEVKDAIEGAMLKDERASAWVAALVQWKADAKIETFPDRIP